jgi:hypothetical protein
LPDYGTSPITFCFESLANPFFEKDLAGNSVGSILKSEFNGGRYLKRSCLMPTGDSLYSLSDIRRILSLCGGSCSESQSHVTLNHSSGQMITISSQRSIRRIGIPSSVTIISWNDVYSCSSLTEVIFASDCHVKEIGGFGFCTSLCRIVIPSSVEIISRGGFCSCS